VEQLMLGAGLLKEGESLYDPMNIRLMHHLNAALRAHALYKRDVEYIVRGGEVIIVDEFTGRTMPGRRWSDGLHQAVEAKEGVRVREENQTVASITFQNYFRLYKKLSGMTGTADTEAPEFLQIYGLEVVVIPTHRPMIRKDNADFVYSPRVTSSRRSSRTSASAWRAAAGAGRHHLIETSEHPSGLLNKEGVATRCSMPAARARGAHRGAGRRPAAITIATNMAGRGTDIVLGGNLEAELAQAADSDDLAREGMRAAWQTRHDRGSAPAACTSSAPSATNPVASTTSCAAARTPGRPGLEPLLPVDGRQPDAHLRDPLRTQRLLKMAGMRAGEVIESGMLTSQIEKAQRKVESHNFDIRKNLLLFDDVANDQRKVVYSQRTEIMATEDLSGAIRGLMEEATGTLLDQHMPKQASPGDWDQGCPSSGA
jgi:preprotein translocase subunit SecA